MSEEFGGSDPVTTGPQGAAQTETAQAVAVVTDQIGEANSQLRAAAEALAISAESFIKEMREIASFLRGEDGECSGAVEYCRAWSTVCNYGAAPVDADGP